MEDDEERAQSCLLYVVSDVLALAVKDARMSSQVPALRGVVRVA
jgi:hypothetical protein